jgi:two-component system sensor histidine kinase/response regulator
MDKQEAIKILLVDDREENLLALETILENSGYELVKARSGREALRVLLNEQDFYLIIMDVMMPDMDGFETAELIGQREKLKNIPIIFLTALDVEGNVYKGYKSGAVDYISKPVVPDLLRAKVGAFVDLSLKTKRLQAQEEALRNINLNLQKEINERKASEKKITELNRDLEKRLAELESLDAFASSVSHDLVSPLNNITGLATLLLNNYTNELSERPQELVKMILESTQKMSRLINSMLLFSRQANAELNTCELDMNAVVAEVLKDVRANTASDHHQILVQDLPNAICDETMIKQVWVNFISNAIKYSQKKENPIVEVGTFRKKGYTVYYVKDNGAGFDMRHYNKLFDPFKRLHNARDFDGTGIGLSIVKRIVERHGGEVWAESEPEKGATFYFSLKELQLTESI